MSSKVALLIGVSEYGEGIPSLSAPRNDVTAMKRVLKNPKMGGFDDVEILSDPDLAQMQKAVQQIFTSRSKDDLVLLFFSGHGFTDDNNKLYFATKGTSKNFYKATSVPASFIQDVSLECYARRQVMILDCSFSGAFAESWMLKSSRYKGLESELGRELGAEGRVVLTSSTAVQKSFQREDGEFSLYTQYILEGIETGAADNNSDGKIYAHELHEYAKAKVKEAKPRQEPGILIDGEGFNILISQAPINDPELSFRKLVEKYAVEGRIILVGKYILQVKQQDLGITNERAQKIIDEVLAPYRKRLENIEIYKEAFTEVVKHSDPLTERFVIELQSLQDILGLEDQDVAKLKEQKLWEYYSVCSQQIRELLYKLNRVNLEQFPKVYRDFIQQKFDKEYDYLNLVFRSDEVTLEVSELKRMNEFKKIWTQSKNTLVQNDIAKFRSNTDKLTGLFCESLAFKLLDDSGAFGQLYGRMIDASNPAFQLNIRSSFPLIYACKISFSEKDVSRINGLLNQFGISADFFALLVVFGKHQQVRQQVRNSPFKNDFIVLNHDQLWDILAAKSPIQQLTNCILEQIDLIAVSPYTVGGPVPEKMFFGRAEEEKTLLQNIARNDYALLANRKTGKTSLLNKISARLKALPNFQVFNCDLQAVSDYESFFGELTISYPEFEEEIIRLSELSPLGFRRVVSNIKQRNSNRQIIFIFDEVDELLAYDIQEKEKLSKTFRTLSQREDIRFIFSGTTTLVRRVRDPDSPFFNFCDLIKLELLEEKAARELVTVPMKTLGVKFDNEAAIVQRILDLTARHPNIIQYICDALIQRINEKQERIITEQDLESVVISPEFYEYFESLIWGQSTALEKLIVYAMWSYPEFTESEVIEEFKHRGIAIEGVKASLEILLTYSTLSKKENKYFFTFQEFAKLMEKRSDIQALTKKYQQELENVES